MRDGTVESARGRLQSSPYSALREIVCNDRDGTLELEGNVPTYYLEQVARTLVAGVEGVTAVANRIEVTAGRHR
jgi:osmotically-inducible protein OsmY